MAEIKLLNDTQKKQLAELLTFYKYFYICNECGTVYGSDKLDNNKMCPVCEEIKKKESKKNG